MAKAVRQGAVCAGVNRFRHYPYTELRGCVNDAQDVACLLMQHGGYRGPGVDIRVLTDDAATRANILEELQRLVQLAREDRIERIVFSLSTHGTQVPDLDGDEPDLLAEAFCPHDVEADGANWSEAHIIRDDDLHDLFRELPLHVRLEVVLDACHAGDGIRTFDLLPERRPRYLPASMAAALAAEEKTPRMYERLRRLGAGHILWSACGAKQTSADALVDGAWHGAFTYYFCKEIRDAQGQLSRRELLERIRKDLKGRFKQVPRIETEVAIRRQVLFERALSAEIGRPAEEPASGPGTSPP